MSFHQLAPYTSHEEVIPEFQKYWEVFKELTSPKATTRQSLRFINRIKLPEGVTFNEIGEYAKIAPSFALEEELEPLELLSRVQLNAPNTGHLAFVTFAMADTATSSLELIFDLDVACSRSYGVSDPDLWESFDKLRDLKNRLFRGSLHEKCLDLFK